MSILLLQNTIGTKEIANLAPLVGGPISICAFVQVNDYLSSAASFRPIDLGHNLYSLSASVRITSVSGVSRPFEFRAVAGTPGGTVTSNVTVPIQGITEPLGIWRPIVGIEHASNLHSLTTTINGELTTATRSTGVDSLSLLSKLRLMYTLWAASDLRACLFKIYDFALSPEQVEEYAVTGTIAGVEPAFALDALEDWGDEPIPAYGKWTESSGIVEVEPPATWYYSSDNPVLLSLYSKIIYPSAKTPNTVSSHIIYPTIRS